MYHSEFPTTRSSISGCSRPSSLLHLAVSLGRWDKVILTDNNFVILGCWDCYRTPSALSTSGPGLWGLCVRHSRPCRARGCSESVLDFSWGMSLAFLFVFGDISLAFFNIWLGGDGSWESETQRTTESQSKTGGKKISDWDNCQFIKAYRENINLPITAIAEKNSFYTRKKV